PRLPHIVQVDRQDVPQSLTERWRSDRDDDLDALREIPRHPVRRSDEEFTIPRVSGAIGEVKDPRVLEEPSDDGPHADRLRSACHARTQAAKPSDDEIDRKTLL